LRHKVLEKNPDEFYFGMLSKKGPSASGKKRTGTLNGDRGFEALSQEAVRLYKTQDLGYIRTVRNKTAKEVETLRKQLLGIHGCEGGKVVFVDDEESQLERLQEDNEEDSDDDAGNDDISKDAVEKRRLRKLQQKEAQKVENRLKIAEQRLKALSDAEEALDLQRAKMAKSPTVGGFNKDGVKFRVRERKR
jgi:U3 small nucleolar RNA-associated protein 11